MSMRGVSMRGMSMSLRHVEGEEACQEPVRGGSRAVSGRGARSQGVPGRRAPPLLPAPRSAPAPSSAEGAAVPRGGAGRGRAGRRSGRFPGTARRGAARARPRSAAVRLPGRRQRRGGARWRPGWGRGCWPWPWGRQVRGGHGGRRGRGWARLVLLPRGRAEAWSSPSVPGSGWELCVGEGGCVGTRILRERPWLSREDLGVWGSAPGLGLWQETGGSLL